MWNISTTYSSYTKLNNLVAGCDEVDRGCLAGPLAAAAVILLPNFAYPLLKDSKQLTPKQRLRANAFIRAAALDWAIAVVDAETIDRMNVLIEISTCKS